MSKKSINVIGILINTEYKDFKLYQAGESWEHNEHEGINSSNSTSGFSSAEGLNDILDFLSLEKNSATQFVIVYDISCSKKEEHIKKLLSEINKIKKNELLPSLVSIGHEETPLNEDIRGQVSLITEVANTRTSNELLKNIVENKVVHIKKEIESSSGTNSAGQSINHLSERAKANRVSPKNNKSSCNLIMRIIGGFMTVLGVAAFAVAFAVLNAATFGIAGLVMAGIGAAIALTGMGLFAAGSLKKCEPSSPTNAVNLNVNVT